MYHFLQKADHFILELLVAFKVLSKRYFPQATMRPAGQASTAPFSPGLRGFLCRPAGPYLGMFGDPVPQDVEHPVGCCPPDHELFVTVPLVRREACRARESQPGNPPKSRALWGPGRISKGPVVACLTLPWKMAPAIALPPPAGSSPSKAPWKVCRAREREEPPGPEDPSSSPTWAGQRHSAVLLFGRGTLVGSGSGNGECRSGRESAAAAVLQLSARSHHHSIVVGEQRELCTGWGWGEAIQEE